MSNHFSAAVIKRGNSRRELLFFFFALLLSILFLGITSKSSPLYPLNDWVDVNCFLTMGKGILHKVIPYRDLYEQKGPLLYLLFAGSAFLSESSYFGVFILEVICFSSFLYYLGRTIALYTESTFLRIASTVLLGCLICISKAFAHGGGAEELHLPCIMISLYSALRITRKKRAARFREAFVIGLFFAAAAWTKYSFIGIYAGLALFVLFLYISLRLHFKDYIQLICAFSVGFLSLTIPCFLYLAANSALTEMFQVYISDNLNIYAHTDTPLIIRILSCTKSTLFNLKNPYFPFVLASPIFIVMQYRKNRPEALLPVFTFPLLALTTYYGGRSYSYYGLIFAPFSIFGLISAVTALEAAFHAIKLKASVSVQKRLPAIGILLVVLGTAAAGKLCMHNSQNVYLMGIPKEDTPQYIFADIIHEKPDATLLNYGFLDGGFYFASDVLPSSRAFCRLNIGKQDLIREQEQIVNEGTVDFVITRNITLADYNLSPAHYRLASTAELYYEDGNYRYYLWEKTA